MLDWQEVISGAQDDVLPGGATDRLRDLGMSCNHAANTLNQVRALLLGQLCTQHTAESGTAGSQPFMAETSLAVGAAINTCEQQIVVVYTQIALAYAWTATQLADPTTSATAIDDSDIPLPSRLLADTPGTLPPLRQRTTAGEPDADDIAGQYGAVVEAVQQYLVGGGPVDVFDNRPATVTAESFALLSDLAVALHGYAAAIVGLLPRLYH